MCGINGFTWEDREKIEKMNKVLKHRGPDDEGFYVDDEVSLGHVRLAIIDLSEKGHQPMKYEHRGKEVWIVYNGEIYNYMEIRAELEKKGYEFHTHSDTEVILAAYLEWSYECVHRFNGMWAFAIYDKEKKLLFLSRDRFGIKPLYYHFNGKNIIFSSEIKGILQHEVKREIDENKIKEYLMFRGVLGNDTLFKGIKKLPPGHNMVFHLNSRELEIWRYWYLKPRPEYEKLSFEEAKKILNDMLEKSVKRRLIADVKVGAILSGGLDSSVVTAYMRDLTNKVITFTVRFKSKGFDEGKYALKVAKYINAEHCQITMNFDDYVRNMEEYAKLKDEPIGVPNEVALYVLSKHIRNNGVYVVLSGEGSDEIFYGYNRIFKSIYDLERMRIFKAPEELREKLPELYARYGGKLITELVDMILERYPYWKTDNITYLFNEAPQGYREFFQRFLDEMSHDEYHELSYFFVMLHLPVLLNRVDNSTMFNAVESRVPFLDHELVEFVFSLPNHYKSPWKSWEDYVESITKSSDEIADNNDVPKFILKEVARDKIPDEIIERKKMGFPVPFLEWKDKFLEYVENLLNGDAEIYKYIEKGRVTEMIDEFKTKENNYVLQRIWMLVSLELWLRNWGV